MTLAQLSNSFAKSIASPPYEGLGDRRSLLGVFALFGMAVAPVRSFTNVLKLGNPIWRYLRLFRQSLPGCSQQAQETRFIQSVHLETLLKVAVLFKRKLRAPFLEASVG